MLCDRGTLVEILKLDTSDHSYERSNRTQPTWISGPSARYAAKRAAVRPVAASAPSTPSCADVSGAILSSSADATSSSRRHWRVSAASVFSIAFSRRSAHGCCTWLAGSRTDGRTRREVAVVDQPPLLARFPQSAPEASSRFGPGAVHASRNSSPSWVIRSCISPTSRTRPSPRSTSLL
jgi:hypothetical protein